MLVSVRNDRGIVVDIEVEEAWMLSDFQKAYNASIGARKYVHYFVAFPKPIVSASKPIIEQLKQGDVLDAVQAGKTRNPIELCIVFNQKLASEERVLIYADQSWTIKKLKAEISIQMEDEKTKWASGNTMWKKLELKYGGATLSSNEWTLRDYAILDCEIYCEPVTKMVNLIVSAFKWFSSVRRDPEVAGASPAVPENLGS